MTLLRAAVGDLAGEFKGDPERAEELPLTELAARFAPAYKVLGC